MEVLVILTSQFFISLFHDEPRRNKDVRLTMRNSFPSQYRQFASHFLGQRRYEDDVLRDLSFSVTHPCHSLIITTVTLHLVTRS